MQARCTWQRNTRSQFPWSSSHPPKDPQPLCPSKQVAGRERALKFLVKFLQKGFVVRGLMETRQIGSQVHKTDEEKGIYRRGCSPWEGGGLMDRTVTVTRGPESRQGRRGEEKV